MKIVQFFLKIKKTSSMAEYKVVLSFQKISHPEMLIVNGVTALGYILNWSTASDSSRLSTLARSSRNLLQF